MFEEIGFSSGKGRRLGSGAEDRKGRKKIREIILSLDEQGDTDDLQEAFDMLGSEGGKIKILAGRYEIKTGIEITGKSDIIIEGGEGAVLINKDTSPEGLENGVPIMSFYSCENIQIEKVNFENGVENTEEFPTKAGLFFGGITGGCKNIRVNSCFFDETLDTYFDSTDNFGATPTEDIFVTNCTFKSGSLSIHNTSRFVIVGNNFYETTLGVNGVLGNIENNIIKNGYIRMSRYFDFAGVELGLIINSNVIDTTGDAIVIDSAGTGGDIEGLVISNNRIIVSGATNNGIYLYNHGTYSIRKSTISGNSIKAYRGILIGGYDNQILYNNLEDCTIPYTDNGTDTIFAYGENTGDQSSSDFNLADLADVDDTDKAEGKVLQVNADGNHEYVDVPSPDLSAYAKLDGTNQPFSADVTIAHVTGDGITPVKMVLNSTTDGSWTIGSVFAEYDMHSSDTSGGGAGIRVALKGVVETAIGQQNGLAIYTTSNGPGALSEKMRISGTGNVRIGAGIPSVDFEINKNGGADCRFSRGSTSYRSTFQMYTGTTQDFIIGTQAGDSNLYFLRGLTSAPYSQSIFQMSKSTGDIYMPLDNQKLFLGAGFDCSISYDGTNMIINPKAVGSGILDVQGVIQTDGYNSSDGTQGITTTFVDADGNTIGVKDGLIVSKTAP